MKNDCAVIEADDNALGRILRGIFETVTACGGMLHPGIRFVARDGHFGVYCNQSHGCEEQLLFSLPREALVPLDGIEWAAREDQLQAVSSIEHLTPLQRDLLALHVDMYNVSRKLTWAVHNLPAHALQLHLPLLGAVQAIRPGFAKEKIPVAWLFLKTRVFKLDGKFVLMPLVDLLNHHPKGAPLQADATKLTVGVAQPSADDECFASYGGRRDVLDLALHYGYADRNAPFAYCASMSFDLPNLGNVAIIGHRRPVLHPLDPPEVRFHDGGMALSHLTCDRRYPQRLRTPLRLAILGLAQKRGVGREKAELAVMEASEIICSSNLGMLEDVQRAAEPLKAGARVAALMNEAAALQADIVREVLREPGTSGANDVRR